MGQCYVQVGADIERVTHGAEEESQTRPQTVVDGSVGEWSDDACFCRIHRGDNKTNPEKKAPAAKVEYTAVLALELVVGSIWPPPPRPLRALKRPMKGGYHHESNQWGRPYLDT